MDKIIAFILLLGISCTGFAETATEFSPRDTIEDYPNGKQIIKLLENKNIAAERKREQLQLLISKEKAESSAFYAFAYYRILHDIELSNSAPLLAEKAIVDLLEAGKRLKQDWLIAEANMWLATFAAREGRYQDGISLVDESIALAQKTNFLHLVARGYNTKAALYFFQDQYYFALEYYLKALDIFMTQPEDPYVSKVLSNVSLIYLEIEEWDKAWESNVNALSHVERYGGDYEQISAFNNNAAFILERLGRVGESMPYLIEARNSAEKSGELRVQFNVMTAWLHFYLSSELYESAKIEANECIARSSELAYRVIEADCSRMLSKALIKLGDIDAALAALNKTEALYKQIGTQASHADMFNNYALAYEGLGDYKVALEYQRKANVAEKELLFDKRGKTLLNLSETYKEKYRLQEVALLKAENDAHEARLAEQEIREKFLCFFILVAVISISLLIKKRYWLENDNRNLQSSNLELYKQSNIDTLTGLYNRRYFLDFIAQQQSSSLSTQMCLAIIDVDHFKAVNDTYGHDVGDEVLVKVGSIIQKNIREQDLLVRWGGEEFVLSLSWPTSSGPILLTELQERFEQVRQEIADTVIIAGKQQLNLTVSIGVGKRINGALLKDHWQRVLEEADKALYRAKAQGRNKVVLVEQVDRVS
ncbi:GGDEF domain-containing protein [Shewanella fidelis]|uniref:diguanylate cyclase n=1 Tax=Shewanella fidelis TaxID=173509 RepID=A0AAW8NNA0_9GAMM|nr:GGDEF domain-containing protein [Shewanella fidelis]MDR8524245.1 GGDEF domain-containing protein [Shewanella fidelis]MDW4813546.1 GGDEF domain-containing protein [Shewanella fidelis]MDW4817531.1 GGDEF domain-containing protein [Shewanella fidelis]MDW4821598.1 GGDEF domain-containing protein [Shewanella fidelis]MDW4825763.1 GGDEF domain-containing protein [Shewanella fidelis]